MAIQELSNFVEIHGKAFGEFMSEFIFESDRAAVILGAAKIETLLGNLLEKYLLPCTASTDDLLEGDSPLSTFSARIKMCNRLGLIDNHFTKLLNIFRKLRNGFAHEITHSNLSVGSARDRVSSMAEPFHDSEFFQNVIQKVADQMNREAADSGVIFRSVLAIFHVELLRIQNRLVATDQKFDRGIVEQALISNLNLKNLAS